MWCILILVPKETKVEKIENPSPLLPNFITPLTTQQEYTFDKLCFFIKETEKFSPVKYLDHGQWAIGYGHAIKSSENIPDTITLEFAEKIFIDDVLYFYRFIKSLSGGETLNESQRLALTSFVYNIGESKFKRSTLYKIIFKNKPGDIRKEFLSWVYASGKVQRGLILRRQTELSIYFNN